MPLLEANPDGEIIQVPNGAQDEFTLACSWPGVESNATLTYSVEWMINDDLVDQEQVTAVDGQEEYQAYMNNSLLTGLPYGTKVRFISISITNQ